MELTKILIEREVVESALQEIDRLMAERDEAMALLRNALEVASEAAPTWVPCSERMPEPNPASSRYSIRVLVGDSDGGIRPAHYDFQRKCWDDGDFYDYMTWPTHWMPLPEPPTPGSGS